MKCIFQSTLPVWGATMLLPAVPTAFTEFQSTLPVWGATLVVENVGVVARDFNPRSPCGERHIGTSFTIYLINFNPRSPCGERLSALKEIARVTTISIHAPRVGSDCRTSHRISYATYFNPRSPCGNVINLRKRQSKDR